TSVLRSLSLPTAAPQAAALAPAQATVVAIDLPDPAGFPTPAEKVQFLLHAAAEVEHALLVQYLYAGYSLKKSGDVTDPQQKAALDQWPKALRGIAREEMGHLMTVQNLLLLTRQPLHFERQAFPQPANLYPFKMQLEPLTQRSLAKYVIAESPFDAAGLQ